MDNANEPEWEITTQEDGEGVRYVASLACASGGVYRVTSALLYFSEEEALAEGEKLVERVDSRQGG